jgi:hypothetical protein
MPPVAPPQVNTANAAQSANKSSLYIIPTPAKADMSMTPTPSATYSKADVSEAKPNAQDMILSRMAERIITKQYSEGNQFYKLLYGHIALRIDPNLRSKGMGPSREELLKHAREMVGANGPFSPENAASQIVDFVRQQSENDSAKTERYRAAVQDAFARLATMTGGDMPELTQKTYDAVMEGFDAVATSASPVTAPIAAGG